MNPNYLFSRLDLYSLLENQKKALREALAEAPESLVTKDDAEVTRSFIEKYDIVVPVLDESGMEVLDEEVKVDVSRDHRRAFFDHSGPSYISGTRVTVHIPFQGDAIIFDVQPSSYSLSPPRGIVQTGELILQYEFPNDTPPNDLKGHWRHKEVSREPRTVSPNDAQ